MKKVISILLALAMSIGLAACSGSPETSNPSGEDSGSSGSSASSGGEISTQTQEMTITVYHYMGEATKQAGLEAVQNAFVEANPEYAITWNNVYYNQNTDYFPQLQTALASGEQPEIMHGNPGLYPDLLDEGYVADLTDNEVIKSMNLPDGDLGDVSKDGKIYAFPLDFKSWGVFYNVKMFEDLDLEVPTTLTELLEVSQALADAGIDPWIYGYATAANPDAEVKNTILTWALDNGDNDIFENICNGSKSILDYPYYETALENWAECFQWLGPDALTTDQNTALERLVAGDGAMTLEGTWVIGDLETMIEGSDFEYGFFVKPIDDTPNSARLNVMVDQCFMLNPNAQNYDTALEFLEYWAVDGADSWSSVSGIPLLNGSVGQDAPEVVKELAEVKKSGNISHMGDFTAPWTSQFTTIYRKHLTAFIESYAKGSPMTAHDCLVAMQAEFDQALAES